MSETSLSDLLSKPEEAGTEIHMKKSAFFRVIHADSAWFSFSASKNIHLTFYSERAPIPRKIIIKPSSEGLMVEDEKKRDSLKGGYRELESDVVMSLEAAQEFHDLLGKNIAAAKKLL